MKLLKLLLTSVPFLCPMLYLCLACVCWLQARLVAIATHSLCDAANAMVQGQASEEKLISSSKQVAASTAQLLLACKVKANPNSKAMQRLQVMTSCLCSCLKLVVSAEAQEGDAGWFKRRVMIEVSEYIRRSLNWMVSYYCKPINCVGVFLCDVCVFAFTFGYSNYELLFVLSRI